MFFTSLGFPTWLIFPLAILKIFGVLVILIKESKSLKELAYAGFLFDVVLALAAQLIAGHGGFLTAIVALIMLLISWAYDRKVFV
ncbi:MAG: DoxX family protein [Leeuwenhoekiella sp.]